MSAVALLIQVNNLIRRLSEDELLLAPNSHKILNLQNNIKLVTWNTNNNGWSPVGNNETGLDEYLNYIRNRDFSVLLLDGAILQFKYKLSGGKIVSHRLCYFPCPIYFEPEELMDEGEVFMPVEDFLILLNASELRKRLRCRPAIRFEFDPANAKLDHPASHVHLGRSLCRIPVAAPLMLNQFLRFIFKNFYPDVFETLKLGEKATSSNLDRTITEIEKLEMHISF